MKFIKTQALGNDFLLVEAVPEAGRDWTQTARAMCHRLRGIGADGLIVFGDAGAHHTSMKLFNADGSPAEISGNGLRCLGAYLIYSGRDAEELLQIETDAGLRRLEALQRSGPRLVLRSELGMPRLHSKDVPFELEPPAEPVVEAPLQVEGRSFAVTTLNMGNPQCVVLVDRLDMEELRAYGPLISSHPRFPRKTNVELVEVLDRSHLRIGIWERGVGETAASGTGSAASVVAARLSGKVQEKVTVHCPGGDLDVEWPEGREVYVTGEAVVVAEGRYLWD